ncbi:MAG TPA: FAD-linked oxidase C-terminal domain-containing protein [Candidatus Hydrogenedentes bacterium]|mgnify:FL=1|nr:FAD-linked oxidase C-terminal domain-containing protein [Candidatus Hydrogenedentota bacterium]
MHESKQRLLLDSSGCEIRFDDLSRQLYATDASIYQIVPLGVAFPKSAQETARLLGAASEAGVSIVPRGSGTGLAGGAIGSGLVVDFSKYNRQLGPIDVEQRTVRAGAGVVLDQLNAHARQHGLWYGPDVATSSRATLGGMIANNSSGARAPKYGLTGDHVRSVEAVFADGRIEMVRRDASTLPSLNRAVAEEIGRHEAVVRERFPDGLRKRWAGYGFGEWLRRPGDLTTLLSGSEGTLVAITSAELELVPIPKRKGLAVLFFASVIDAMQATVDLLDLEPAAIEHVDRMLLDQTRGQLAFAPVRSLLELDAQTTEAALIVEFWDDVDDQLAALTQRRIGIRQQTLLDPREQEMVWAMRKAGVALLMGVRGSGKPIVGIEDTAVRPERLPDYVRGLQSIMSKHGLRASLYGHAASGLLHIRPVIDLHKAEGVQTFREVTQEVSALVREFKGSISAEHGVGIAQTPFLREHLGEELIDAMKRVKTLFDPRGVMNPGKMIPDGTFETGSNLRWGAGYAIPEPFDPVLHFTAKDGSFVGNLEQCNGCGGCRKDAPTMCPTFIATGDEIMSTRGRANAIRAVLDGRLQDAIDPLKSPALDIAIAYCLACKACTAECPSNVNMTLLKAELLNARNRKYGLPLRERVVSVVDIMGALGTLAPGVANASLRWTWVRRIMERVLGIAFKRPLPPYAHTRFDRWFRARAPKSGRRGDVFLWDDTFVRYHEPNVGQAAVAVLEAAGYRVHLIAGRKCCGRPSFSVGHLDRARKLGEHNIRLIQSLDITWPILFLEPSCYAMFAEDYRELGIAGAEEVAKQCMLFEQFIWDLLQEDPEALAFREMPRTIAIHAHCHAKALTDASVQTRLAQRIPGGAVRMMNTGCCGMAGSFGASKEKYDVSVKVAQPLVEQIEALDDEACVVACGTSCRHQITHLTEARPLHIAELLADALR